MRSYLILIFLFFITSSNACDCVTPGIEGRYNSSDLVIKGKVINKVLFAKNDTIIERNEETGKIEKIIINHDIKAYFEYTIRIIEKYKGKERQNIIKVRTEAYSNCAADFEIEFEYLMFLDKKGRKYLTDLCSGNEIVKPEYENKLKELKSLHTTRAKKQ